MLEMCTDMQESLYIRFPRLWPTFHQNKSLFTNIRRKTTQYLWSRNSDWLRAGRPMGRSSISGRVKNFLSSMSSIPALGPSQPHIQWVPGALSQGVKRSGREGDHSPPTRAEVKIMWIYTITPPYAFLEYCLCTGITLPFTQHHIQKKGVQPF
jgi:hypothetical protein